MRKLFNKIKSNFGWICKALLAFAVLLVFIANIGAVKSFLRRRLPRNYAEPKTVPIMDYHLEADILNAMNKSHEDAYQYASQELDKWIDEMLARADNNFLDEYFGYLQSKRRDMLVVFNSLLHQINGAAPDAEEAAIEELENQISARVIKPELSQQRIENITNQAFEVYLSTFDNELAKLQDTHKIPTPEWNKYVSGLCGLTMDTEQQSYPVSFKMLVVSGGTVTGIAAAPIVKKVAVKVSTKLAEKAAVAAGTKAGTSVGVKVAEKTAVKAGTKAAAKGTASAASTAVKAIPVIGWGITGAVCIWDIVDHVKTSKEGKRVLRQSLVEYFAEVKKELLGNNEASIMGVITMWENDLKGQIVKRNN